MKYVHMEQFNDPYLTYILPELTLWGAGGQAQGTKSLLFYLYIDENT